MMGSAECSARLLKAVRFAAEKHRDHRRKGVTAAPYINHPITVAEQLADAGYADDTDLLMAAVLHDVLEDTETTPEELEAAFGRSVANIVQEVTDDKALPWQERRAVVIRHIGGCTRAARLLKLSDLTANVFDIIHHPPDWSTDRKLRYLDWAEAVAERVQGTSAPLESRLWDLLEDSRRVLRSA